MKISIGVFFGGYSVEHEISIISALQAINAIDKSKYDIIPIYISKEGRFYTGEPLMDIENYTDLNKLLSNSQVVTIVNQIDSVVVQKHPTTRFGKNILGKIDIAFPIVHGTYCEDGTLQGFFELLKLPYIGPNVLGSAVGMDKIIAKKVLKESGIPTLEYTSFSTKEWNNDNEPIINEIESKINYPVIIKPANLGSSVGVKKASNRHELEEAVSLAQEFTDKILVERAVTALKEINCSVLGDYDKAEASVCEEPIGSDEILSYNDKYLSKGSSKGMSSTKRKLPAEISKELEKEIKELAVSTFQVLGCSGVARVDFLMDTSINKVYVNEINTIPGSLSFYLWEATGKSYTQLIDDLVALALKRERERNKLIRTYDTNILSLKGNKNGAKSIKG